MTFEGFENFLKSNGFTKVGPDSSSFYNDDENYHEVYSYRYDDDTVVFCTVHKGYIKYNKTWFYGIVLEMFDSAYIHKGTEKFSGNTEDECCKNAMEYFEL